MTRDYVLDLDAEDGKPPLLSVFGGKITTYRKLAEHALEKLDPSFPNARGAWTATQPLPGGGFTDFDTLLATLIAERPGLPPSLLRRLARAYGTDTRALLGNAQEVSALGRHFGGDLYAREVDYLVTHEWAQTAEDILYRRGKLGLHVPSSTAKTLEDYLSSPAPPSASFPLPLGEGGRREAPEG